MGKLIGLAKNFSALTHVHEYVETSCVEFILLYWASHHVISYFKEHHNYWMVISLKKKKKNGVVVGWGQHSIYFKIKNKILLFTLYFFDNVYTIEFGEIFKVFFF